MTKAGQISMLTLLKTERPTAVMGKRCTTLATSEAILRLSKLRLFKQLSFK